MRLKYIKLICASWLLLLGNKALSQAQFNLDNTTQLVMSGVTQVVLSGGADLKTITSQINIGGGTLTISGVVQGPGNFIGSPTSALILDNTGTGTLNFAAGAASLNNFTLNKSGSSITLNTPLTISGLLALQAGVLNTTTANLLTLGTSGAATGSLAYTSGQISGPFQRWFATATNSGASGNFPIGNGITIYNPTIEFTAAPTNAGTLTAEWLGAAPGNTGLPLSEGGFNLPSTLTTGYWKIDAGNGLAGGTYTTKLAANGFVGINTLAKLRTVKRPSGGGNWTLNGTAGTNTGTIVNPVIVRDGMSGFSEFAIALACSVNLTSAVGTDAQTVCQDTSITSITYSTEAATGATVTGLPSGVTASWAADVVTISGAPNVGGTFNYTVTQVGGGCDGTSNTGTITVNPTPTAVATPSSQTVCSANPITTIALTGAVSGTTYAWTRDNTATVTGIAASGSGDITGTLTNTTTAPVTVTFTITPTANGCPGLPITATVLVNPTPTVNAIANRVRCNGQTIGSINFTSPTTGGSIVYNWTNTASSIGIPASGSGNILNTLAINTSNIPVVATLTVTPAYTNGGTTCNGTPMVFTITVNPTPNFSNATLFIPGTLTLADPVYNRPEQYLQGGTCVLSIDPQYGTAVHYKTHTFTLTAPSNVTISLLNSDGGNVTPIGRGQDLDPFLQLISPAGFVPAAACTNSIAANDDAGFLPNARLSRIITTTPLAAGTYTIVVSTFDNTPGVGSPTDIPLPWNYTLAVHTTSQTVCNGSLTAPLNFTTTVPGTVFNWTNNNTSIGLAASGSGSIASFTATNATTSPVTATITVLPTYTNAGTTCTGAPILYYITVNPTPTAVVTPSSQTVCSANPITTIALTGAVSGTTYNWTRDNTATVTGIGASGSGDITGALTNTTTAPVTVTFTITPTANGCLGAAITATVLVNPTPNAVATPAAQTICNAVAITPIVLTGAVSGTTYNWTRDNTVAVTGIGASGSGNISGTLTNTTVAPVTVTFTITPTANGCPGTAITATVIVNPTPVVNAVPNQVVCNGVLTTPVTFTTPNTGTTITYNWTNNNASIGLAAAGSGNIGAFTAVNTGTTPVVATVTVTPTIGGSSPVNLITNGGFESGNIVGWTNTPTGGGALGWVINNGTLDPAGPGVPTPPISGNFDAVSTQNNPGINLLSSLITLPAILTNSTLSWDDRIMNFSDGINCPGNPVGYFNPGQQFKVELLTSSLTLISTVYTTNPGDALLQPGANSRNFNVTAALAPYAGQQVYVRFSQEAQYCFFNVTIDNVSLLASGACTGTPITYTYTVNPTPTAVATPSSQTVCSANPITTIALTGAVSGTTYNWTRDNAVAVTGIAASGSGDITGTLTNTTTAPVTVTFTITPTANGCPGTAITATVLVNPTPTAVATPASQTVCSGNVITTIALTGAVSGTTYNWTRDNTATVTGIAASGSGDIAGTLTNTTTAPVTVTFTITPTANGCLGAAITATVLVNPTPNAVATPAAQTICNAVAITPIVLTGAVSGTTYNWTRDNTVAVTGIAASGSGNITGTLTNTTVAPVTVTFTITPTANGCPGAAITATVIVNPTPVVNAVPNQVVCNGVLTTPVTFTTPNTGTTITYNWTNNNTSIGLAAAGSGNIGAFTAVNTGTTPVVATVTVTPTIGGSAAVPVTFTNAAPIAINGVNGGPATPYPSTIAVSGLPTTGVAVQSIRLNGITHAWSSDVDVLLVGPGGQKFVPMSLVGGSSGFDATATVTISDAGATTMPTSSTPIPSGTYRPTAGGVASWPAPAPVGPYNPSAPAGSSTFASAYNTTTNWNGTWSLYVNDNFPAADNGSIAGGWAITLAPPSVPGCTGTPITYTYTVNPTPTAVATPAAQTICSGTAIAPIVLTGAVAGTTYAWTRDNTVAVTGIAASGSGNISGTLTNTTPLPVTVTFTIIPTANGCPGLPITATVLVNPRPVMTALPAAQTICNGVTITPIVFASTTPGTTYTWTRDNSGSTTAPGGIQASGSGPSITGFMINTTNAPITVTFTITPTFAGCVGITPVTATVTIQPTTTAVATPATQLSCSGQPITTINLTSPVAGTVYNWTRDNVVAATGIAASGTGNISGTLTTTGTTPVVVTFTITPSINGCLGVPIIAVDTINPTPTVTQPGNQVLCNGSTTTAVAFTGAVPGTVFNWTNNTPSIGLAATGTGNIPVFTAVNTTNAPVTATITVTPVVTSTGCVGVARTFTITVNPTANVGVVPNQTLCTGSSTAAITFTGTVAGTTFSWTNNTPSIGLAASGTGNIPSFTAINTTPTAVTATITVTPNTAAGCVGVATTFTITVNGNSVAPTGAAASVTTSCGPTSTTLSVVGGALGTGASWRWYSGSCGGVLVGTGASITIPVNTTTTYFVRAEGTCNTTLCSPGVTVTINTVPTISIAAAPYTALTPLLRTNLTATVSPTAVGNVVEWYYENGPTSIATGLSINNITVDQVGSYRAKITTAQGCTATSNTVEIRDSATGQLFVYPNPNRGQFQIRYYLPENSISVVRKVAIFDSKGALVYNQRLSVQTRWGAMNINLNVAQGGYFIKILDVNENEIIGARVQVLR